ncbi:glycoside hydrolase family 76 protein [Dysgonomonas reticulitermitis]
MKNIYFGFIVLCLLAISSCSDPKDEYSYGTLIEYDWSAAADSSSNALINKFWNETENYFNYGNDDKELTFHYWPNAHAMDVVIDAYIRTNDSKYSAYFDKWFSGIKIKNGNTYKNDYVDDMEWNALTMLRLYNVTKDQKYLDTAQELWGWIKDAWSEDVGGGIRWCTGSWETFTKNACSNGPAAIIAARMYQITQDEEDLEWAKKIYEWQKQTLVVSSTGEVKDHIVVESAEVSGSALTYNEGTYVGAGVELYNITKDVVYLNDAKRAANYTISTLVNSSSNVLRDEGTGDNGLFKGIFMRYFLELIKVNDLEETYRHKFVTFLNNNAYVLWTTGVYKGGVYEDNLLFGSSWDSSPVSFTQLTSQASGCMLIEVKAAYENSIK